MVIRPMTAVQTTGEIGRPATVKGGKSGPASFFSSAGDVVSLNGGLRKNAGLYSAGPLFKIMGAVELMSEDVDTGDEAFLFGDNPVLI